MLGSGLTVVVTVGLFAYGGHLLDGWTGTSPLFLLAGLLLGVTGGFIHLFSVVAPGMLPWGRSRKRAGRSDDNTESSETPPDDSTSEPDPDSSSRPPES